MDGGSEKVLGYLFLQVKDSRAAFSDEEMNAINKAARQLWPVLAKEDSSEMKAAWRRSGFERSLER